MRYFLATAWVAACVCISTGGSATAADDSSWQTAAFSGQNVSLVVAHPFDSSKLASVASGVLELSDDSGVHWRQSNLPLVARAIAYDPVRSGFIYIGTDSGLYWSEDNGTSWRHFESNLIGHKITTAIYIDSHNVFVSMYDGAGTPVQVWRIGRDGVVTNTLFPSGNASSFSFNAARHRLYVGAAGGVYLSEDEGSSWRQAGIGAGSFSGRVVAKGDTVWQQSADGLFKSDDAGVNWKKLAGPGDLNGTYYGSDMHLSGLAVNRDRAFYGAWSIGFPFKFLAEYDGGAARSVLDAKVNDVADGGSRLWAATTTGLMVNDGLVSSEAAVRRPVVIVPGILGSWPTTAGLQKYFKYTALGKWDRSYQTPLALDPIQHTYDGLISSLLARGYQLDQTLFVFPYNWMNKNEDSSLELAQKINDIRQRCGCSQVDVVAHSMGGLVARSYIEGQHYQGDVRNLIEIATPNSGAVGAYPSWEGGEVSGVAPQATGLFGALLKTLTGPVSAPERTVLIRQYVPALGQLLPVFSYLEGRQYAERYPRNQFLEELNQEGLISLLKQRVTLTIIGSDTTPTPALLTVGVPSDTTLWPDGEVLSTRLSSGDGAVLTGSLSAVAPPDILLPAGHLQLVSASADYVASVLMGGYVEASSGAGQVGQSQDVIGLKGEVCLSIRDPSGRVIDDNQIDVSDAYFSGFGSNQLAAIPHQSGTYEITLHNSSSQPISYDLFGGLIDQDDVSLRDSSVSGQLAAGKQEHLTYDSDGQVLSRVAETGSSSLNPPPTDSSNPVPAPTISTVSASAAPAGAISSPIALVMPQILPITGGVFWPILILVALALLAAWYLNRRA